MVSMPVRKWNYSSKLAECSRHVTGIIAPCEECGQTGEAGMIEVSSNWKKGPAFFVNPADIRRIEPFSRRGLLHERGQIAIPSMHRMLVSSFAEECGVEWLEYLDGSAEDAAELWDDCLEPDPEVHEE